MPYDDNRVELKEPIDEDVDYINASWINGQIAAQGPMPHTTPHFLQMLIEQKIQMVIMLTKTEEALKDGKCCAIHHCIFSLYMVVLQAQWMSSVTGIGRRKWVPFKLSIMWKCTTLMRRILSRDK